MKIKRPNPQAQLANMKQKSLRRIMMRRGGLWTLICGRDITTASCVRQSLFQTPRELWSNTQPETFSSASTRHLKSGPTRKSRNASDQKSLRASSLDNQVSKSFHGTKESFQRPRKKWASRHRISTGSRIMSLCIISLVRASSVNLASF